jgi:hypothetical protein
MLFEKLLNMVRIRIWLWIQNRNRKRNRNFSKVGTGTRINSFGATTLGTYKRQERPTVLRAFNKTSRVPPASNM